MKRWRVVPMTELQRIWTDLRRKGIMHNGCTHAELQRRYGTANIKHVLGYGWYKLTAK